MRVVRLAAAGLAALALATPAGGSASGPVPVSSIQRPTGLRAFLLRATDSPSHSFPRTPSFAWSPVPGAVRYEFEVATSQRFTENAVLWSKADLKSPVAAVPISLPWVSGAGHALYAHVRAITRKGATPWSAPYGFDVRWTTVASPLPSYPGMLRWTPVSGASQYNVWLVDAGKVFTTVTNVADEREYYSFHQQSPWPNVVHWRVRAERYLYGTTANGLPAVSFGPWSPVYTSVNPPFATGPLSAVNAVSDTVSDVLSPRGHQLMPGFTFSGNQSLWGTTASMYRVYISTDRDCLNIVFRGAVVGSPAYAPRSTGPLVLPKDTASLTAAASSYLADGDEGTTYMADGSTYTTTELLRGSTPPPSGGGTSAPPSQTVLAAKVDLWDSDWPTGRYYWTVVPVDVVVDPTSGVVTYRDAELPQEACAAGRVLTFGKSSQPVLTGTEAPYASGLSPMGQLAGARSSTPKFYGTPLVAWEPALGADEYEVQWSHRAYPWTTAGKALTFATAITPDLSPGTWYYRVRGFDFSIPNKTEMSWSTPAKLVVTRARYRVVR